MPRSAAATFLLPIDEAFASNDAPQYPETWKLEDESLDGNTKRKDALVP
jgi:hypothetical protein